MRSRSAARERAQPVMADPCRSEGRRDGGWRGLKGNVRAEGACQGPDGLASSGRLRACRWPSLRQRRLAPVFSVAVFRVPRWRFFGGGFLVALLRGRRLTGAFFVAAFPIVRRFFPTAAFVTVGLRGGGRSAGAFLVDRGRLGRVAAGRRAGDVSLTGRGRAGRSVGTAVVTARSPAALDSTATRPRSSMIASDANAIMAMNRTVSGPGAVRAISTRSPTPITLTRSGVR